MNEQEIFNISKEIKTNGLSDERLSLLEGLTMKYIVLTIKKQAHKDTNLEEVYKKTFDSVLKLIEETNLNSLEGFMRILKNKINTVIKYTIVEQGTSYIPPHFLALINDYKSIKEKLEKEKQREVMRLEIADAMRIPLEKVELIEKAINDKKIK